MEKDNKRKNTPDINEEMMMNLMVDGVKKDGLKLPSEPVDESQNGTIKSDELPKEKSAVKEKLRQTKPIMRTFFSEDPTPMPVTEKRFISDPTFTKN